MRIADLEAILASDLPALERMTALVIASYINETNREAWPSVDTIAARGGMSRNSALRTIRALNEKGWLSITRRFSKSTKYQITHVLPSSLLQALVPERGALTETSASQRLVPDGRHSSLPQSTVPVSDRDSNRPVNSPSEQSIFLGKVKKVKLIDQGRIVPPTLEMVQEYCTAEGNGIDPEAFMFHYGQKDWMLSKGIKMKNWKMSIGTWVKNREKYDNKPQARPSVQREQDHGPEPVYDQAAVDAVTTDEHIKKAWDTAVRLGCAVLP